MLLHFFEQNIYLRDRLADSSFYPIRNNLSKFFNCFHIFEVILVQKVDHSHILVDSLNI